jgi:hypothetical protein
MKTRTNNVLFELLLSIIFSQCCSPATAVYGCHVYCLAYNPPPNYLRSFKHAYLRHCHRCPRYSRHREPTADLFHVHQPFLVALVGTARPLDRPLTSAYLPTVEPRALSTLSKMTCCRISHPIHDQIHVSPTQADPKRQASNTKQIQIPRRAPLIGHICVLTDHSVPGAIL